MAQVKKKILMVDDEPDVGLTLKMILEEYGFDVDCFTDPRKVLENFRPVLCLDNTRYQNARSQWI